MRALLDRLAALDDARFPGGRTAFLLGAEPVGWLAPRIAAALAAEPAIAAGPAGLVLDDPAALPGLARALADRGLLRWRNEAFDVRATPDGPALSTIDRGAIPAFGIEAQGIHMDGLVRRQDGLHIWIGRRSPTKALDPDKLDHIVAGGTPAGHDAADTLVKEAAEEAGMQAALAARARPAGVLRYANDHPTGLRRDLLHCYEVELPESFTPVPRDGEVACFALWPLPRLAAALRDEPDAFKFNVIAVMAATLLRHGAFPPDDAAVLAQALLPIWTASA